MYTVYGMSTSGNCYKVKLTLEQLNIPYQWKEIDTRSGETHAPEFLKMNPIGQVPVLEIKSGQYLSESNAILFFLSENSSLWPESRLSEAKVLQWMFFEQYSHEPYIAVARFINRFLPENHPRRADLPRLQERGNRTLHIMNHYLENREFIVDDKYSIADIALYAYTHVAEDGGFDISQFPAILSWLKNVKSQPRHVQIGL